MPQSVEYFSYSGKCRASQGVTARGTAFVVLKKKRSDEKEISGSSAAENRKRHEGVQKGEIKEQFGSKSYQPGAGDSHRDFRSQRSRAKRAGSKKERELIGRILASLPYYKKHDMMNYTDYQSCIDACLRCATVCQYCATSCLKEKNVADMAGCISLDMRCAAACYAAAQMMSMGHDRAEEYGRLCADLCRECAEECRRHDMEHCQLCAKVCRACAEECAQLVQAA